MSAAKLARNGYLLTRPYGTVPWPKPVGFFATPSLQLLGRVRIMAQTDETPSGMILTQDEVRDLIQLLADVAAEAQLAVEEAPC